MKYYCLEPEVAGGLGADTVIDRSVSPTQIEQLHYVMDGWLGDGLLESFPSYIVTNALAHELNHWHPTGARLAKVKITKSPQFEELHPNRPLPEFMWLKVFGAAGKDDFGISVDNRLVVSERVLNILKSFGLSHCGITVWSGGNEFKSA